MQASQAALTITKEEPATLRALLNQIDAQLEELLLEHIMRFEGRAYANQQQCDGTLSFLKTMQTTQQAITQLLAASPRSKQQERCSGMIRALALYLQTTMHRIEIYCQACNSADIQTAWYLRRTVQDGLLALLDKTDRAYDVLDTLSQQLTAESGEEQL